MIFEKGKIVMGRFAHFDKIFLQRPFIPRREVDFVRVRNLVGVFFSIFLLN